MKLIEIILPLPSKTIESDLLDDPARARNAVTTSMRQNHIQRPACCVCSDTPSLAHHENYKKPMKVVFLCRKHHAMRHVELGWGMPHHAHSDSPDSGMQIRIRPDQEEPLRVRAFHKRHSITTEVSDIITAALKAKREEMQRGPKLSSATKRTPPRGR